MPTPSQTINSDEHSINLLSLSEDGRCGFEMRIHIHDFIQRFAASSFKRISTSCQASGACWRLVVNEDGSWIFLLAGLHVKQAALSFSFGEGADPWDLVSSNVHDFSISSIGKGRRWLEAIKDYLGNLYTFINLQGSLQVTVKLLFALGIPAPVKAQG